MNICKIFSSLKNNKTIYSSDFESFFTIVGKKLVIKSLDECAAEINAKSRVPFSEIIGAAKLLFDNTFCQFNNEFNVQIFLILYGFFYIWFIYRYVF